MKTNSQQKLALLFTGLIFLSGCISIPLNEKTTRVPGEKIQERSIQPSSRNISAGEIKISEPKQNDLQQQIRNTRNYLEFQQRYNPKIENILGAVRRHKFNEVETRAKSLATELEQDPNPYAKQQLERVKEFTYVIYEKYDLFEKKEKTKGDLVVFTIGLGFAAVKAPFEIVGALTGNNDNWKENIANSLSEADKSSLTIDTKSKKIGYQIKRTYVCPYTGKERIFISDER